MTTKERERNTVPKTPTLRRLMAPLTLGLVLTASSALAVVASTPELPPNAGGNVALCPDAASGGLQTILVAEADMDAAMTEGTAAAPCAASPGADAVGPQVDPEKGYFAEEIADGVYWVTEGVYQVMFVVSDEGVIVVDAPPSMGAGVVSAIAEVTDQPITHVIYSHSHADHIAGAGNYPADATYIAHADTASQLEASFASNPMWGAFVGGAQVPLPTVTFEDTHTLTVGNQTLELSTPTALSHEPGNIFVYAPAQNVLLHIDVVFPGWSPFKDLAQAEDTIGYLAVHDEILAFGADAIVTGHVGRLGTNADVEINMEYMADIQTASVNALSTTDFSAIGGMTGFANPWLLFDTYLDALTAACEAEVVPNWVDRLGGADIFTADHCYRMFMAVRID
jgi:glyoxylase-like metal-dependent hydrolase (beta-lactamase superfamily II)